MKKLLLAISIVFLMPFVSSAQKDKAARLAQAQDMLEKKDVRHAVVNFRKLYADVKTGDTLYPAVAQGMFQALFMAAEDAKKKNDWESLLDITTEALQVLELDKAHFSATMQQKKYWLYENMILASNGMAKYMQATAYEVKLYEAHKAGLLPDGLNKRFNVEKFTYKGMNIGGYEWFVTDGAKQVYYVYTRDSSGNDNKLLYTLETMVPDVKEDNGNAYVFARRSADKKKLDISSAYKFTDPVSIEKLHKAVLADLDKLIKYDITGKP